MNAEAIATMIVIVITIAALSGVLLEAIKKVVEPLTEGCRNEAKLHASYPLVNLVLSIFLAIGTHAAIDTALNLPWFMAQVVSWVMTGFVASLGAKYGYDLFTGKKFKLPSNAVVIPIEDLPEVVTEYSPAIGSETVIEDSNRTDTTIGFDTSAR